MREHRKHYRNNARNQWRREGGARGPDTLHNLHKLVEVIIHFK
jgi:hypothetical protein